MTKKELVKTVDNVEHMPKEQQCLGLDPVQLYMKQKAEQASHVDHENHLAGLSVKGLFFVGQIFLLLFDECIIHH